MTMICRRCHSNSVNTGSRLPRRSDVKTRKRRNVVGINMIRNNRSHWTLKNTTTYDIGNPSPGLGQEQNVVEINRLIKCKSCYLNHYFCAEISISLIPETIYWTHTSYHILISWKKHDCHVCLYLRTKTDDNSQ